VIITLIVNARLDRRRQLEVRTHEREVIRRSLLAELTILRDNVQADVTQLAPIIEKSGGVSFFMNEMLLTKMYDRVLEKMGLLSAEEAQKVIIAYSNAKLLPMQVLQLKADSKIKESQYDKFGDGMVYVPAPISESIVSMMRNQLRNYNDAIMVLSKDS
jgi:hypothetical protein